MKTVTEFENRINDLESQNSRLTTENAELAKEIESLEKDVDSRDDEINELEDKIDNLNVEELRKALELFADPDNWDGNKWKPAMPHVERDMPDTIASEALARCSK